MAKLFLLTLRNGVGNIMLLLFLFFFFGCKIKLLYLIMKISTNYCCTVAGMLINLH